MNTKIIVALVLGIALVGLTGAASAAVWDLNSDYIYTDNGANTIDADTELYAEVIGYDVNNVPITHMHSHIWNDMAVTSVTSPASDVLFDITQGGESHLTIVTDMPGNLNTFVASDIAFQNIEYVANGDVFDIDLVADSDTHASTHFGILPIGAVALWDENDVWNEAFVNYNQWNEPMASIKRGNTGYVCESNAEVLMEAEHVLGPVTAGSSIVIWGAADGEIWEPMGEITNDIWGQQDVWVWWP